MMIKFRKAYFIKLGHHGMWEEDCIKQGTIRLGFCNPHHLECTKGNYDPVRTYFEGEGKTKGVATGIVNLVKSF
jgi:hypothetical protein